MSESFIAYLWQYQYFQKTSLTTTDGSSLEVLRTGMPNDHAGPDFYNVRLRIDGVEWGGCVELHVMSSEWYAHGHQHDDAYENVILHVVWQDNKPALRKNGSKIPTLALKPLVSEDLLWRYRKLVHTSSKIACSRALGRIDTLTRVSMLDKTLLQRLETKAAEVSTLLDRNRQDWAETCYQVLGHNFGFKINAEPFAQLTRTLPYRLLARSSDSLVHMEALLFGQAGLLPTSTNDPYVATLQQSFSSFNHKYSLKHTQLQAAQWRFLRLRPANFPSLRIAQFAALMHARKNIFSHILANTTYASLYQLFTVTQSAYWIQHYHFAKQSHHTIAGLGDMSINNIIINTVVPLLVAYGKHLDEQEWIDRAITILHDIKAENNSITRQWAFVGMPAHSAFDSQAQIELYNNLCMKKQCLSCKIGLSLMKSAPMAVPSC